MRLFGPFSILRETAGEGGEGGGGAVTMDAIKAMVEGIVNGAVNGLDKRYSKQFKDIEGKIVTPPKVDDPPADDPPPGDKTKPDANTIKLTKQVEALNAKLEAEATARKAAEASAREEKRHSIIRNELAKHQYAKENGIDAAFRLLEGDIKYGEDGSLTTPDETPIGDFLTGKLNKEYDYLLAPLKAGGSGATPGARGGKGGIALEDIKPGMSAEQRAAAMAAIAAAQNGQG